MDFHRRIELRFAICFAKFCAVIKTDGQFCFRNFTALRQTHHIHSGYEARPARSRGGNLRSRRNMRRFRAHRPSHAIETGPSAGRQFVNDAAGSVEHFQLQFSKEMALALIVIDHRSVGRVIADEHRIAIGPAAIAFNSLLHGTR